MLLNMAISLYTSRIVLSTLGFEDYGLYNVVGGVIALFSFMQTALTSATQRFLNFALGENSFKQLRLTFSTSIYIHLFVAVFIFIIAQTIGLYFILEKLNIPSERLNAAIWVYQMSICSCITIIISLPYNALIIAHERMDTFTYISILEVVLKLVIVYFLKLIDSDKLIIYAILMFVIQLIIRCIYQLYCKKHFPETQLIKSFDKSSIKKLGAFIGWNLFGNIAMIGLSQGINILLNIYNGLAINAARAIAVQVQGAVNGFCSNFQVAINPQITKSCACRNYDYLISLVIRSCKISFFVLFLLALPIIIEIDEILIIWLNNVPNYTSNFVRIILCISLIDSISNGLGAAIMANGKIKIFQITNSIILLMTIPISLYLLKHNFNPISVFITHWTFDLISQISRLLFVRYFYPNFSLIIFFRKVYLPVLMIVIISPILPLFIHFILPTSILRVGVVIITAIITTTLSIYLLGLDKSEKEFLHIYLHKIIIKIK